LGKISENRRGDFFDSHCIREILQPKPSNVYFTIPSPTDEAYWVQIFWKKISAT